jgi:hypothetical protein
LNATAAIRRRREKILADRNLVRRSVLPIKPRPGESETYNLPDVRRKARVSRPKTDGTREPYTPERELAIETLRLPVRKSIEGFSASVARSSFLRNKGRCGGHTT